MVDCGDGGEDVAKHEAEVARLREQVSSLVQQARVLLHGDAALRLQKPIHAKRAERERELEETLEKAERYRREVKKLRPQLDACYDPHLAALGAEERDPMELQNLIVEKRKDLQRLKKNGEGLDKIAEAQQRAERAQNALSPELEEKLRKAKADVEEQKRLNVRLQAERHKVGVTRQKAEEEARAAGGELRSKAAGLRVELRPKPKGSQNSGPSENSGARGDNGESADAKMLRQLRRENDILEEAVRQDERKFKAAQREDTSEADYAARQAASLRESIAAQEAEVARLRAQLTGGSHDDVRDSMPQDVDEAGAR